MAGSDKSSALPETNIPPEGGEGDTESQLVFIRVQPHARASTVQADKALVRRHAAGLRWRDRHRKTPEGVTASFMKAPADMKTQVTRFRLETNRQGSQKLHLLAPKPEPHGGHVDDEELDPRFSTNFDDMHIQDGVSTYRRDPFTTYPIKVDDEMRSLFTFYLSELNDKKLSQDPDKDFIPIVLSDAACFHVLLATLLQIQRFNGRPDGWCFWYHRGAALSLLNHALSYQHADITDNMFYAVGMLSYVESRIPDCRSQSARLHIAALLKFLEVKKGTLKVEICCMLIRLAFWCCFNPPPFSRPPSVGAVPMEDFNSKVTFSSRENSPTCIPKDMLDDIKYLLRLTHQLGCKPMSQDENEKRDCVYQRFVSWCLVQASKSLLTPIEAKASELNAIRCTQLAKILFAYIISPSMSVSGVYSPSLIRALRVCLEASCDESGDAVVWSPEVLCWILVTGAVAAEENPMKEWYLRGVANIIRREGLQTPEELQALLHKIIWSEGDLESACRRVWEGSLAI